MVVTDANDNIPTFAQVSTPTAWGADAWPAGPVMYTPPSPTTCIYTHTHQETYTAVLLESTPRNSTVATLQVQDRDLRVADGGDGSGDLEFNAIGEDSSDFVLYPMFMGDGLWDLAVVTDAVSFFCSST